MRRSINMLSNMTCKVCSSEGIKYCPTCDAFICSAHLIQHNSNVFTSEHLIFDTKEYSNNINNGSNESICSKHAKNCKFYCGDCFNLICEDCFSLHFKHAILPMEEYITKQRSKMKSLDEFLESEASNIKASITQDKKKIVKYQNRIQLVQESVGKKSIQLNDLINRKASIEKASLDIHDCDILDHQKFENSLDFIQTKFVKKITGFSFLPNDIWQFIFSKLRTIELLRTSTVCIEWKNLVPNSVININLDEFNYKWYKDNYSSLNGILKKFVNLRCVELKEEDINCFEKVFQSLTHIKILSCCDSAILNNAIKLFTNLTILDLDGISKITDEGIKELTNLNALSLSSLESEGTEIRTITDTGIKKLANLTTLVSLSLITNAGIKLLTNLQSLFFKETKINDIGLKKLTNLTFLCCGSKDKKTITNDSICLLKNLKTLLIPFANEEINNDGISSLFNLTSLSINGKVISYDGTKLLSNLTILSLRFSDLWIEDLRKLTKLTELNLETSRITSNGIKTLTNLTKLTLSKCWFITSIPELVKLSTLRINYVSMGQNTITRLTNLTYLATGNNSMTDSYIKEMTSITSLGLFNSTISDIGIRRLRNLRSLELMDINITENGFTKLTNLTSLSYNFSYLEPEYFPETTIDLECISELRNISRFQSNHPVFDDEKYVSDNNFFWCYNPQLSNDILLSFPIREKKFDKRIRLDI